MPFFGAKNDDELQVDDDCGDDEEKDGRFPKGHQPPPGFLSAPAPVGSAPPPRRTPVEGRRGKRWGPEDEEEEEGELGIGFDWRVGGDGDGNAESVELSPRHFLCLCITPVSTSTEVAAARSPAAAGEGATVEDREREERDEEEGDADDASSIGRRRRRRCCSRCTCSGQCIPNAAGLGGAKGHQTP